MSKSPSPHPRYRYLGALALVMVLAGCPAGNAPLEPKILTFNYGVVQVADAAAYVADIQSGQTNIADELGADPCNFTADADASTPLSIDFHGQPGQRGFNVTITSATLVSITTTNPAGCLPVSEINMTIGARNEALDVGGRTNKTMARFVMGGDRFSTQDGFFEGTLSAYNRQTGYGSGEFQVVAASPARGENTLLLVLGSYADD